MSENEWHGEPHTLTVHSVRLPDGPFDDGEFEYDLEHPPSCKEEARDYSGMSVLIWTCDVARMEGDLGLAFCLRYSGTPVTGPGTYRIQGWGTKSWTELGYEYDGGVAVMDDEEGGARAQDGPTQPAAVSPASSDTGEGTGAQGAAQ